MLRRLDEEVGQCHIFQDCLKGNVLGKFVKEVLGYRSVWEAGKVKIDMAFCPSC